MTSDNLANQDYERAVFKAIWRAVIAWMTGKNNELLPFDEVRDRLPLRGQHDLGLKEVRIDQIVGSLGRYRDFDRAFLPRQLHTKDRWLSIDKAHHRDIILPPVELYKLGEVYFVKDGNHRVSVARERGQEFVDAHVTEIDILVPLTIDTKIDDLDLKRDHAIFIETTNLPAIRPSAQIELTLPGEYDRILEHINVHRWYLGESRQADVPFEEAVASWYDNVYIPLVKEIEQQGIAEQFPTRTCADLYLWVIEYLWYRREAYKEDFAFEDAARNFVEDFAEWPIAKLVNLLKRAVWVDYLILDQERTDFLNRTGLDDLRPEAHVELTMPGFYQRLLEHINVHRWYLGEHRQTEIPYPEAVTSWYDQVYFPLVKLIREQNIIDEFPGRTESDLYLWIIEHLEELRGIFGDQVPIEQAAEHFTQDFAPDPVKKVVDTMKKRGKKKE
jgi:hypothetical protein